MYHTSYLFIANPGKHGYTIKIDNSPIASLHHTAIDRITRKERRCIEFSCWNALEISSMGVSSRISGVFLDNVKGKQKKDKNQSEMLGLFTLVWKKSIGVISSLLCLVLRLLRIWK